MFKTLYKHSGDQISWKGMRLIVVDGSTVYLADSPDIVTHFGTQKGHSDVPMGQALSAFDVLNGITIKTGIYPIKTAEQKIAKNWLKGYESYKLLLYDRGYVGFTNIFLHGFKEQTKAFLMHCRLGFNA